VIITGGFSIKNPRGRPIPDAKLMVSKISLFWRFQLAGWLAFTIFSFPSKWVLLETIPASVLVSLYRDGLGFLITIGMREIYKRCYHEKMTKAALVALMGGVSLLSGLILTLFSLAFHEFLDFDAEQTFTPPVIFGIFYFRTGLCLGWSLLYFGIKLLMERLDRERALAVALAAEKEAELQMLRAQMNPHFLFNALTTIQAGLTRSPETLRPVVQALSDYLSFSLSHREKSFVPVGEEYDALVAYLAVEKARFRDDIEIECRIDPAARDFPVPGILLQPLLENAIGYGRKTSSKPLRIRMEVSLSASGSLQIEVANTGTWVEEEDARKFGGIGLGNVRKRMALIYPDRHRIEMNAENGWVTVKIEITP
jgi:sensor histidine kinase YesM